MPKKGYKQTKEHREAIRQGHKEQQYERKCLKCEKIFITNCSNKKYCYDCSDSRNHKHYIKMWRQKNKKELIQYERGRKMRELDPQRIWKHLGMGKKREWTIINKIRQDDFVKWYDIQKKQCIYCGIKENNIIGETFQGRKACRLWIDRKDNLKGYVKGNLVLSCPRCNCIKGDFFTFEEMLKIGKVIAEARKRIKKC